MSDTKIAVTLKDCKELKALIINNPELPLVIFAGEDSWNDDYAYSWVEDVRVRVDELAMYGDEYVDREDYEDKLRENYVGEYNIEDEAAFDEEIRRRVNEAEFTKAIVIYVG